MNTKQEFLRGIYGANVQFLGITFVWRFFTLYYDLSWIHSHTKHNWRVLLNTSANPSFFVKYPNFGSVKYTWIVWFLTMLTLITLFLLCFFNTPFFVFFVSFLWVLYTCFWGAFCPRVSQNVGCHLNYLSHAHFTFCFYFCFVFLGFA